MYGVWINEKAIKQLLKDFYTLSGMRIAFYSYDFSKVYSYPKEMSPICALLREDTGFLQNCRKCDKMSFEIALKTKETYIYKCHFGLYEAVSPIFFEDKLLGYFMLGQVFSRKPDERQFELLLDNLRNFSVDTKKLMPVYLEQKHSNPDTIRAAAKIMDMSSKYIYLSKVLQIRDLPLIERVKDYVQNHYDEKLSLSVLSLKMNISPSYLCHILKKHMNTTLTDYINAVRIGNAKRLLSESDMTITQIASKTGFAETNYFSRVFKKITGTSPVKYRTNFLFNDN